MGQNRENRQSFCSRNFLPLKYCHRSVLHSIKTYILPPPLGGWNTEYGPFFIQIIEIPSKKLANTEYRHVTKAVERDYFVLHMICWRHVMYVIIYGKEL